MRYFLELAYKGTAYHGWQVQANAHTVQAELHRALETVLRQPVETVGSGRTDTGVHALQQFVHFDFPQVLDPLPNLVLRLNSLLPADMMVRGLYPVADDAHARFDADFRKYEYRISRRKNPFLTDLCFHYSRDLNTEAMNEAAQLMLRYEDFECFSRVKTEVNHFRCRVTEARWEYRSDPSQAELLVFHIQADRFLRGMVRAIVGTLLKVGAGQATVADVEQVILSRDRRQAGHAVPPQGLFLTKVGYPPSLLG